jgi:hypothetical protein
VSSLTQRQKLLDFLATQHTCPEAGTKNAKLLHEKAKRLNTQI